MTFLLLKALKAFLEEAFAHTVFRVEVTKETHTTPKVHIGALPPKRRDGNGKDFPFIVVRPSEGEDDDDGSSATVRIVFGTYTEEDVEGGLNDVMNMVDRCRRFLFQHQLLDKKYVLNLPLKWHCGVDEDAGHPHPYYHGTITTNWNLPSVEQLLTAEDAIKTFGSGYPAENSDS
jgi:hypothetical protein